MRRIIATLILSPVLLHAQVSKQAAGISLEARTDALKMAMPAVAGAAGTPMLRISTGVLAAKVIKRSEIVYSANELNTNDNRIVVKVTVNENGVPQNPQIVSSLNPALNQRVIEAVQHYRFQPAQLDRQAVPERVNLTFVFER
jgi:TonB family protein